MKYAIIIAGGIGSRFWPLSRSSKPKHLLNVLNDNTLLENTIDRIKPLISVENIRIVSNSEQQEMIKQALPGFNEDQLLIEPLGKNTAAAIGYGAVHLDIIDPDATMIILPSDHYIDDEEKFIKLIEEATSYVERNPEKLATIGIKPRYAETGYGYIQAGETISENSYKVRSFAEKPNYQTALRFVESGDFFWNSGIFIWKVKTILNKLQKYMPDLYESLLKIQNELQKETPQFSVIQRFYNEIKPQSIDYGVMEKANECTVFIGDFYWSDVGSWQEIFRLNEKNSEGNVFKGETISIDTKNSLLYNDSEEKIVCTIGLDNLFVVNTDNAVIVAPLDRSQDVKKMVEILKAKKKKRYL